MHSRQDSKLSYLGECHCQNDFLEHYDKQNRLHCYEDNSQGPCEDGKIFVQPDEVDENGALKNPICSSNDSPEFVIKGGVFSGGGFGTKCSNGKRNRVTGKCENTSRHRNRPNFYIGRHPNALQYIRQLQQRRG